jgi:hypothetical protein
MSDIATGDDLATRLCEILGLRPEQTMGICLHADAGSVVRLTAEMLVTTSQADAIVAELRHYRLERNDDDNLS